VNQKTAIILSLELVPLVGLANLSFYSKKD
jgi:hypothetical protein